MQRFQVPQFIMIEDRIIGPLTLRQFLYLLGAGGLILLGWTFLHITLFALLVLPSAGLFVAMAFIKVNARPLPQIMFAAINYYLKPRLYLWRQKREKKAAAPPALLPSGEASPLGALPTLTPGKLQDLAWSLDIKEKVEK